MDEPLIAHVLRRTGFGPYPGQVEQWSDLGVGALLDTVVSDAGIEIGEPRKQHRDDWAPLVSTWVANMRQPDASLHEKMKWFWHGHFTTNAEKVYDESLLWDQHRVLREHALGNFRDLTQAITVDAAMLLYLDGSESTDSDPNENYARELMELFTIGRGNFTESDVRNAAKALSGWCVHYEEPYAVDFFPEEFYQGSVSVLGRRGRLHASDVVDIVCDHASCAPFIARKIFRYLVGTNPSSARLIELANVFRSGNLEIRPLIEAVLRSPEFLENRLSRTRYPIEWIMAASSVGNMRFVDPWWFELLGQMPFNPPNVGGWPSGPRWVGADQILNRASVVNWISDGFDLLDDADPVDDALRRTGLYEVSEQTRGALVGAARATRDDEWTQTATVLSSLTGVRPCLDTLTAGSSWLGSEPVRRAWPHAPQVVPPNWAEIRRPAWLPALRRPPRQQQRRPLRRRRQRQTPRPISPGARSSCSRCRAATMRFRRWSPTETRPTTTCADPPRSKPPK